MTPAMVRAAVQAGMFWTDGVRTVMGEGTTSLECDAGDAAGLIRDAIAAGAPGAFFSAAFDPLEPTTLLIPDRLTVSPSGTSVAVVGGTSQAELEAIVSESATAWSASVQEAADVVASPGHALAKVVLARQHQVTFREAPGPVVVLGRLMRTFPKAFHFSVAGIVGASPELLGQVFDGQFSARALAGTVGREADPAEDVEAASSLLASRRYQHEHALLARYLGEHLAPFIDGLAWERQPRVLTLPNVHHLMTTFTGTVVPVLRGPGGFIDILASIHPTPVRRVGPGDQAVTR